MTKRLTIVPIVLLLLAAAWALASVGSRAAPSPTPRAVAAPATAPAATRPITSPAVDFVLYDALVNRTDDPEYGQIREGMAQVIVIGHGAFYGADGQPDEAKCRARAREASQRGALLVPDIEHLPYLHLPGDDPAKADAAKETIGQLVRIVRWIKDERPQVRVGLYGVPDLGLYDSMQVQAAALQDDHNWYRGNRAKFRKARRDAERRLAASLGPILAEVDVLCPSPYVHLQDVGPTMLNAEGKVPKSGEVSGNRRAYEIDAGRIAWYLHFVDTVALCRKLAPGKPVVPFLWPRYQPKIGGKNLYVSGPFWRAQLEAADLYADGAILWDSRLDFDRQEGIDKSQPWWTQQADFCRQWRDEAAAK